MYFSRLYNLLINSIVVKYELIKLEMSERRKSNASRNQEIDLRADRPGNSAPGSSAVPYTQPFSSSLALPVYIPNHISIAIFISVTHILGQRP
jgi:hypothetical protein